MSVKSRVQNIYFATFIVQAVRNYLVSARIHRIKRNYRITHYRDSNDLRAELRSRDLFSRIENHLDWLPKPLLPIGGAAGALLLYLLSRCLTETKVSYALELGAGTSTRVLNAWANKFDGRVVTLEQDLDWATKLSKEIDGGQHRILNCQLTDVMVGSHKTKWYDVSDNLSVKDKFDLVLVDGPIGTKRFSRLGVLNVVENNLADEWTIIWDDLHRPGDLESFGELLEMLRKRNILHEHVVVDGDRSVGLVFTPAYRAMKYMW